MKKFILFCIIIIGAGSAIFLTIKDIPAPQHPMEKVVSNDRFIK